jgi:hypothetical protein
MKKEYTYKGQTIVKSGSGWASIGAEFCISVYVWAKTLRELKQKIDHKIYLQSI